MKSVLIIFILLIVSGAQSQENWAELPAASKSELIKFKTIYSSIDKYINKGNEKTGTFRNDKKAIDAYIKPRLTYFIDTLVSTFPEMKEFKSKTNWKPHTTLTTSSQVSTLNPSFGKDLGKASSNETLKMAQIDTTAAEFHIRALEFFEAQIMSELRDSYNPDFIQARFRKFAFRPTAVKGIYSSFTGLNYLLIHDANDRSYKENKTISDTSEDSRTRLERFKEWLFDDTNRNLEHQRGRLVPLITASKEEIYKYTKHKITPLKQVGNTIKNYPFEFVKFQAALFAVQLAKCYHGGVLNLSFKVSNLSPNCADNFFKAVTSVQGAIGFSLFIYVSPLTSQAASNLVSKIFKHSDNLPLIKKYTEPFMHFLGLAAGAFTMDLTMKVNVESFEACFNTVIELDTYYTNECMQAFQDYKNSIVGKDAFDETMQNITVLPAAAG